MRYLDVAQLGQTRRLAGLLSRDLVLQHSDLLTIVTNPVAIVPALVVMLGMIRLHVNQIAAKLPPSRRGPQP